MTDLSRRGNANRGCAAVDGVCIYRAVHRTPTEYTETRPQLLLFFCAVLNHWAVFGLLQLSRLHTPTHAYTLTCLSGLKCESEYQKKERNTSLSVTPRQTQLPLRPSGSNRSSWPIEILFFPARPTPPFLTLTGTLSPWQCFTMKLKTKKDFLFLIIFMLSIKSAGIDRVKRH